MRGQSRTHLVQKGHGCRLLPVGHWQKEQSQLVRRHRSIPPLSPSTRLGARAEGLRRLAALGLLCLSCASGQIGGEVGHNADATLEVFGSCDAVGEERVEADDPSLEIDLDELQSRLDGLDATVSLAFGLELPATFTLTPAPSTTDLDLDIAIVPNSARRIEREISDEAVGAEEGSSGTDAEDDGACAPLLAFDATVALAAENGALEGTFDVVFVASSAHLATAAFDIESKDFGGSFALDYNDEPGNDLTSVRVQLAWADGQLSGSIMGQVASNDGASSSVVDIAAFPADGCLFGHDLPADSTLAESAREAASSLDQFDLTWPDGATTDLTLSYDLGRACLAPSFDITTVTIPATTDVLSADGGIDGVWNLTATVGIDEAGDVTSVYLERAAMLSYEAGTFAEQTGISGIEVDPEIVTSFALEIHEESRGAPASGTITVFESQPALCDTPPPEAPTGGGGVEPGCAGDQLTEVATATLTSRE
jgi:hypothetical protein